MLTAPASRSLLEVFCCFITPKMILKHWTSRSYQSKEDVSIHEFDNILLRSGIYSILFLIQGIDCYYALCINVHDVCWDISGTFFEARAPKSTTTSSWKIASNQIAVVPWDVFTLCGVLGHRFGTIRGVVQITVPVWTIQRVRAAHPPIAHLYCTCFNFLVIWACSHWAQASNLQQHYWIVWVCFYCLPFFQSLAPCHRSHFWTFFCNSVWQIYAACPSRTSIKRAFSELGSFLALYSKHSFLQGGGGLICATQWTNFYSSFPSSSSKQNP